jgi:hypothetical protein
MPQISLHLDELFQSSAFTLPCMAWYGDYKVIVNIKDLNFKSHHGKILVRLTDGLEVLIPREFLSDIKRMSVKESWFIWIGCTLWRILKGKWIKTARPCYGHVFYATNRVLADIGNGLRINYVKYAASLVS